jgi:hypothetical protein
MTALFENSQDDILITSCSAQLFLSDRIYQYLLEDPDNIFKNMCLYDNLQVNFQAIALAKLSGKSLTEIAAEFNVDLENLISFFQDCCCRIADLNLIVGSDFSPASLPNLHR